MFFNRKTPDPAPTPQACARAVLGADAQVTAPLEGATGAHFPFLAGFGPSVICDYAVSWTEGARAFTYAYPLKVYTTQRRYRFHYYAFLGSCLTISDPAYRAGTVYVSSGSPFSPPKDGGWEKNGKHKRRMVWSRGGTLPPYALAPIHKLISWLEDDACAMTSSVYAIFLETGRAHIVFWKPEVYDLETQLQLLQESISRLTP